MTRADFDAIYAKPIAALAREVGDSQLHAAKLGVARIEGIARPLHKLLRRADPRFFVSRVEKRYVVATKMFELLFDSGENRRASPHTYMLRPLRIPFAVKFPLGQLIPRLVSLPHRARLKALDCPGTPNPALGRQPFRR